MTNFSDPIWLRFLPAALQERVRGRAALQAVIHNSGWLVLDKGVRLLLGLLVGVWVARYLGPTQYGELAYALAFIAFFQAVAGLGLNGIVVREVTLNPEQANAILGTSFLLRLLAGIVCWLAAIAGMGLLRGWHDPSVWITALAGGSLVFQAADTVDLWFQSQSQSRRTVLAKLAAYVVASCVKIVLIQLQAPLLAFAAVTALDVAMAAAGLAYAYRRFPCHGRWQYVLVLGHRLVRESWAFAVGGIAIMIYMRIDQIMILEFLGKRELGIYAAVLPFATLWQFIPMTLAVSISPFLVKKRQEGEVEYMRALAGVFRLFSALGWAACLVTVLMSSLIVNIMLGPAYEEGISVLSIYVFTNIFVGLGVAQGLWLLNEGRSLMSLLSSLLGAVVCLIGNFVLIPALGLNGAAVTAVLAYMVASMFISLCLNPKIFALQIRGLVLLGHKD